MGFYIRRSVRVGPFRFNLSKSGIGVSAGVKGLRVGTGPRGHYIHAGAAGFYYRQQLGGGSAKPGRNSPGSSPPRDDHDLTSEDVIEMRDIESGSTLEMTDSNSAALLADLRARHQKVVFAKPAAILSGGLALFLLLGDASLGAVLAVVASGVAAAAALHYWDLMRKSVVLMYDFDPQQQKRYERLHDAIAQLTSCDRVWHIAAEGDIRDTKRNAGATTAVHRKAVQIHKGQPPFLKTNIEVPVVPAGRQSLYFFPDRILVYDRGDVGAVGYDDLHAGVRSTTFVEGERVPRDARVVGSTWKYVNKSGGPDRRFKDNREIPLCLYEELHLSSGTGLNERFNLSRVGASASIVAFLHGSAPVSFEIAGIRNRPPSPAEDMPSTDSIAEVQKVPGVGPTTARALAAAGLGSLESLRSAPDSDLLAVPGVGRGLVRKIRKHLGQSQQF